MRTSRSMVWQAAVAVACLCPGAAAHGGIVLNSGGLVLLQQGGTFDAGNLAQGATPLALDELGFGTHFIANLNNLFYGNASSWIGNGATAPTSYGNRAFAGINLGAAPVPVSSIAFGRDNTATFSDRTLSGGNPYVLQYTQVPNPGTAVGDTGNPATGWATVGTLDYQSAGGVNFTTPSVRHRYGFNPVSATGVRLLVPGTGMSGGTAIDEIELYQTFVAPPVLGLAEIGGTFAPNNLAADPGAVAFAKDLIANGGYAAHQIPHLNDVTYGNSNSWIGSSPDTFAGVRFNGPQTIAGIAWGRDNGGEAQFFIDRAAGPYTVQYTTVPNPDQNTPDAFWNSFQTITYSTDPTNALRHRYDFAPIANVTGLRIAGLAAPTAIDEIEVYGSTLAQPLTGSVIQDETAHTWTLPYQGNPIPGEPAPGDGQYHHLFQPGEYLWFPRLIAADVTVETSWGVSFNHSRDVDFFFDPDGAGPQPEIPLAQNIDQILLNDQQTAIGPGSVAWSGFFKIGEGLDLGLGSVFRVVGSSAPGGIPPEALSSAVWRFTAVVPEPSGMTLGLLAFGGMAGIVYRRRRKTRR